MPKNARNSLHQKCLNSKVDIWHELDPSSTLVDADTIVGGPTTLKVHFIFVSVQQQRDVYDLSLHLEDELDIYTISEFDGQWKNPLYIV